MAKSLTFGSSTIRAGLGSVAGSVCPLMTVCLAVGLATYGAYGSLGAGCGAAGMTGSIALGCATYGAGLGSGAGCIGPGVCAGRINAYGLSGDLSLTYGTVNY